MSVCAPQLLEVCELLLTDGSEVATRAAISRAYYSAYHVVSEQQTLCPDNSAFKIKGGMHERLIDRFLRHKGEPKAIAIGYMLRQMRTMRTIADYKLESTLIASDAHQQVADAKRLSIKIAELSVQSTKAA